METPSDRDEVTIPDRRATTTCGYCTQGRHHECNSPSYCECAKSDHTLV
jgi:hypothetical protein